ncbi:MAG TPA: hypothetical protein VK206_17750, partial [Anaerolineales bacterium]|nr:hypothetical protein [Anaerolineales bacterium]
MKRKRNSLWLAVVASLCIISYAITMFPQDRIFSEYKKAFREIQHPIGTKLITDYNSFGALDKTRVMYKEDFPQGCDYRVGQVREYSGTREAIKAFYAPQTIVIRGQTASPGVLFIPINSAGLIDPYGLTDANSVELGPGALDILESLKNDQHFLNLKPSAAYYYVDIG